MEPTDRDELKISEKDYCDREVREMIQQLESDKEILEFTLRGPTGFYENHLQVNEKVKGDLYAVIEQLKNRLKTIGKLLRAYEQFGSFASPT